LLHPTFNSEKMEQVYPWGTIRKATTMDNIAEANELNAAEQKEVEARTAVMRRLLSYEDFLVECRAAA
jgi:hypothetical protein